MHCLKVKVRQLSSNRNTFPGVHVLLLNSTITIPLVQSLISMLLKNNHPTKTASFDKLCSEHCYTQGSLAVSDSTRQANPSTSNLRFIPYSNNLPKVQLIVVYLCNEDGSHCLVQCCPIHVDGGSHRQHEPRNPPVHMVILQQALESNRQCG